MTCVLRKWLLVALALLALVGAFAVYLLWPRPDELERWKAQMRARGERFSLAEVAPKFSQEKFDWAQQLQSAVGGVYTHPVPPGGVGLMISATPGYAIPAWQRPFAYETATANHAWSELAEQMAGSAGAFHQLHELLRHIPAGSATDYSDPVKLPGGLNLVTLRRAAQGLSLATLNDLHRGSLESALTNLHALIALSRAVQEGGLLVDHMISAAIAGLGVAATWEALQDLGWNDPQLAELDAAWAQVHLLERMELTFEIERAWASELYQFARTNPAGLGPILGAPSGGVGQSFKDKVYTPVWQKAWSAQDGLVFHRALQSVGEGIRDAITNRSWQRLRAGLDTAGDLALTNLSALDQFRYQFSASAIPNWSRALNSLLRQESKVQMARAAIAIERHRLKYGRAPESLANLVPEFLRELPVDPMTGRHLLFAVNRDGSFALYSAGDDGRDDDGLGDDVVWPQAGLPARADLPHPGERVAALTFQDVASRDFIEKLGSQVGLKLRYQSKVAEKLPAKFSITLTNITASEALEAVFQKLNLALVMGPKHTNHCVVANPFPNRER